MRETSVWRETVPARISLQIMRILFIGPSRIGDAVLASGLLNHLTATYPDARYTVACGEAAAPLFAGLPRLEQVIAMRKQSHSAHWWQLWKQVFKTRWSMVVDVRRSIIPWTIVARRRAILPVSPDAREHAVVSFARTFGLETDPPSPRLWATPENTDAARTLLPATGPILAVGPTANWIGKTWRAERFLETVERLTAHTDDAILPGARVAVFGAGTERELAQPVIDGLSAGRCIDLVGRVDLLTAAACLQQCAFYVGNDSGLMHIAAASGLPTLGLFGPSRPERYAPWGPDAAWVQARETLEEMVARPGYDPDRTGTLMDSLAVDDVVHAAHDLWHRTRGEAA
jgi:heptosyltransferase-3